MYETYRETDDRTVYAMPGRLVDVGGYKLHINCTGTGSPTVVLEPGLGEASPMMRRGSHPTSPHDHARLRVRPRRPWMERVGAADRRTACRSPPICTRCCTEPASRAVRARRALGWRHLRPELRQASTPTTSPAWCCSTRCIPHQYHAHAVVARRSTRCSAGRPACMPSLVPSRRRSSCLRQPVRRSPRTTARPRARLRGDAAAQPQRPRRVQPDPHLAEPSRRAPDTRQHPARSAHRRTAGRRCVVLDAGRPCDAVDEQRAPHGPERVARHGPSRREHRAPVEPSDPRRRQRSPHRRADQLHQDR